MSRCALMPLALSGEADGLPKMGSPMPKKGLVATPTPCGNSQGVQGLHRRQDTQRVASDQPLRLLHGLRLRRSVYRRLGD